MPTASGRIAIRRKAKDGEQGLPGLILRTSEWQSGVEDHNDSDLPGGIRYLDIVVVTSGLNNFSVYQCKVTHTASSINQPANTVYWAPFNVMAPIYSPLILADNALLRFAQTNQLLVMKADGTTVNVGLGGGNYPFWIGATQPANAPCKISDTGKLYANGAEFKQPIIQNDLWSGGLDDYTDPPPGPSYDYVFLDAANNRVFDYYHIGSTAWDLTDEWCNTHGASYVYYEFMFRHLAVGVEYTLIFEARHTFYQEVAHGTSTPNTEAEDGMDGRAIAFVGIKLTDVEAGTTYTDTEIQNMTEIMSRVYSDPYHPRMACRIEINNGQRCIVKFLKRANGSIVILNFTSVYLSPSVNYR